MGKYLKKFTTKDEHDSFFTTEQNAIRPNVSLIQNEKRITYNPIFPLYITTWKDEDNNVHAEATKANKKLYEYYMENCIVDPQGAEGETILYLSDDQVLYINNIKVQYLGQSPMQISEGAVAWFPNDIWNTPNNFYPGRGGLYSDGSIYEEWDY